MALPSMDTNNALTAKAWAKLDWYNPGQAVVFGHLFKRGAVFVDETLIGKNTTKGDAVTYSYFQKLTGIPLGEGSTLDGNEEAPNFGYDKIVINVTRVGVLFPNTDTIEQQRTYADFPEAARKLIPKRHLELLDTACFYHLGGAAPTSFTLNGTTWSGGNRLFAWGHNTPTAPTTNRIVRAGAVANDQSLTSSNTLTLDLLDAALELNANSDQPIEPFDDDTFDFFAAPSALTDLKRDSVSAIQWYPGALARAAGGNASELTGKTFMKMEPLTNYAGVNIYRAPRVAYGVNSSTSAVITTVRRNVLVGKNALIFASPYGGRPSDTDVPLKYYDQLKDYNYSKGLEGRLIYGLKKITPSNGEDVGVIVVSTYSASHSS